MSLIPYVVEQTSRAAQQAHLRQPHMMPAIALKRDYVNDTALLCYDIE